MGNTPSEPQPTASGGEGRPFRLPLYRGERDAFLPIDDDIDGHVDQQCEGEQKMISAVGHSSQLPQSQMKMATPPLLSIQPKLLSKTKTSKQQQGVESQVDQLFSPVSAAAERPPESPDSRSSGTNNTNNNNDNSNSPPSVISSSDSSYGTCYSNPTSPQAAAGAKRCSTNSNLADGSILFDCVKPPTANNTVQQSNQQQLWMAKRKTSSITSSSISRSASLTSLFESCVKSTTDSNNDNDNEYYCEDNMSMGDQGSFYSTRTSYQRSSSVVTTSSSASTTHSHNSYTSCNYLNAGTKKSSRNSLVSAFSQATGTTTASSNTLAWYHTEEERNMVDGDEPTVDSDLNRVRNYHVVTTAALPWMTGTAVNPLLRGAYLLRKNVELKRKQEGMKRMEQEQQGKKKEGNEDGFEAYVKIQPRVSHRESVEASMADEQIIDDQPEDLDENSGNYEFDEEDAVSINSSTKSDNQQRQNDDEGKEIPFEAPSSPCCSLDYSCFSLSEINTTTPNDIAHPAREELISPLGEEDSLLLSPFTPFDQQQPITMAMDKEGATPQTVDPESTHCSLEGKKNSQEGKVTLILPWLQDDSDRAMLYGTTTATADGEDKKCSAAPLFANQQEQEVYIREWLANEAGMPEEAKELNILWYSASYHKFYNSIFALGDICDLIPEEDADVCILEEPEHLNWYRAPGCPSWSSKFCHCVGVIHTNYKAYARDHAPAGFLAAPLLAGVNSIVVQANCHRVVKLSGVLQEFAPMSECIENVHGIRETYLKEGQRRRTSSPTTQSNEKRRAYFIGKLLWAKGFDQLLELQASFRDRTGENFEIDIYGSGPDEDEIKRAFYGDESDDNGILDKFNKWSSIGNRRQSIPANFMGRLDHSRLAGDTYSIFINPSLTEVLCTTTAEAIAMGKWAIIPSHPSNAFFVQFENCLPYRNRREFASTLKYALNNDPPQLSDEFANLLSWEAATMRCVNASAISKRDAARNERIIRAKEEKTLTKKLSGFWTASKENLRTIDVPTSSSPVEPTNGYGSIALISP